MFSQRRMCSRQLFNACRLILLALISLLSLLTVGAQDARAANERPNIVFLFTDDHALQSIGAYGSKINETPNIDRIAREGTTFINSFCANSICGPSRACILTGKHSHLNGFLRNGNRFDPDQLTFPTLLQQAGYRTAVIGKWHLGTDPVGFDHWEVLPGQGNYYNPDLIQMDGTRKRFEGYCTDIITEHAIGWLKQQSGSGKPFMLMCQHKAPHRNWSPHPRHFSMFPSDVPEPETLFDTYEGRSKLLLENEMSIRDHFHWGHDMKFHGENLFPDHFEGEHQNGEYRRMNDRQQQAWDAHYEPLNQQFIANMKAGNYSDREIIQWKYQRYIKDYLRCIAAVDDSVGQILAYLEQTKLAENTIVIYSSDQGFYLGEHGWYDKRWMYDESLRMPFIVRWPSVVPAGVRSKALIQNIDYGPTFLDIAGVDVPDEMQGRSLVPVFANGGEPPADWRDAIYYAYYENAAVHNVPVHDGVRTSRYKLMYFPRTREWNLIDLQEDPHEMKSVHDNPTYAAVLAGLQKRYRDIRQAYAVNTAVIPATRGEETWWHDREQEKNAAAKAGTVDLAFIGDSITQGWEGQGKAVWQEYYAERNPINFGFGGDRTEHAIWRLTHGHLANIQPKVSVVMIGTNNTGHVMQSPAEIAAGIGRILEILKQQTPESKILLLGVFPRGREPYDLARLNNIGVNQIVRRFADGKQVHYLEIGNVFLDDDGKLPESIMPDALHLSEDGYKRWAAAIEPKLKEFGL